MDLKTTKNLRNGAKMPVLGFGVWQAAPADAYQSIKWAIEAGIRLIDTAKIYGNEKETGQAIKDSGVMREEIFLTTKLWNEDQGYDNALKAFDKSCKELGVEYIDLYLIHWPYIAEGTKENKREETWKAMEEIYKSGRAKAIGVSNYLIEHLEEMKSYATILPDVNQVEFHPFLYQEDLLKYCQNNQIALEAYSPLSSGYAMNDERIGEIAKKYNKTNAQIMIRWSLQLGNIVIPKSVHKERIIENIDVFDFEISEEDMVNLNALDAHTRFCWDPEK